MQYHQFARSVTTVGYSTGTYFVTSLLQFRIYLVDNVSYISFVTYSTTHLFGLNVELFPKKDSV
jgi:hypothetical protein